MTAADGRLLRDVIRDQATRLFATRGFAGTSLRELAEACACTKPALYHHYHSKEQLFREVVEHHQARVHDLIARSLTSEGSVRERLHELADDMVDECCAHPLAMQLMQRLEASPEETAPAIDIGTVRAGYRQLVASLVEQGISRGELRADLAPEDAAVMLAGVVHLQFELSIRSGQWDRDRIHRTIDLVIEGIANR